MKSLLRFLDQKGLSMFILMTSDALWYFLSFITAYLIRNNLLGAIQPLPDYLKATPVALALMIIVFYSYGLYEQRNRVSRFSEIYLTTKASSIVLILIMAASFLEKYDYSRGLVIMFWAISIIFMNFGRALMRLIKKILLRRGIGVIRVLIIGAGKTGRKLAGKLEEYHEFGYQVIGFLDDDFKPEKGGQKYKYLGKTTEILSVIKKKNIDQVYVSDPAMSHEKILNLMQTCENVPPSSARGGIKFKVVSDLFEIIAGGIDLNELEGIPAVDFGKSHPKLFYRFIKRAMDILCSLIALIIFIPFWLIIAVAIKINSPGPALFKQQRVGKGGKLFSIYKFRTMYYFPNNKDSFSPHSENDNRITFIGKFLRKTSFDEVPQILNILKGEMSLVGPRPEMPFIVAKYKNWQKKRLEVKPGLTGLWQVMGRKDLPLLDNIEYDFFYIKNQSLLLDIVIIFKTFLSVILRKGAY